MGLIIVGRIWGGGLQSYIEISIQHRILLRIVFI